MTQNYHRYLNLPFTIDKPESFKELKENDYYDYWDNKIVPKVINEWLDSVGLYNIHTEAFFTAPNNSIDIHCDTPELDNHVKINFTWGAPTSTTRWWRLLEGRSYKPWNSKDGGVLVARENDCELVYEKVIDRPSLINVGMLHSTYNPSKQGRWTLCLVPCPKGSKDLLLWDDALVFLKDYII